GSCPPRWFWIGSSRAWARARWRSASRRTRPRSRCPSSPSPPKPTLASARTCSRATSPSPWIRAGCPRPWKPSPVLPALLEPGVDGPTVSGLLGLLRIGRGDVVAVAGAGGKTTLVYRLAAEARTLGLRVVVTTTTHMGTLPEATTGPVFVEA